ncbi:MAG: threonine/serine exporter family protein [Oscillospiraceae bacterium]|nr:threonine/serine exporter family protein [Oscillospiraceae bacterium]MBQ8869735.1 threonine/serine exporter family protein [Oscillospiraceae bacterium]
MNNQQLLNIASRLGNSMQRNGAETFRIEDSIARVLAALGATDINVFVINSCFMVSMKADEGTVVSEIRRCTEKSTDLYKIDRLNTLCRRICSEKMDYDSIIAEIDDIESKKAYSFIVKLIGFTIISAGFCFLFGGRLLELAAALIVSVIVYPLIYSMDRLSTGIFFKNIIASGLIALLTILLSAFLFEVQIDTVIIGTFMNLVPGVALTTSMRDIIAGDLISGKNTLTEALVIALGMALGSGLVIASLGFLM